MKDLVRSKVCVCGLGAVGLPTALWIQKHKFTVHGFDLKPIAAPFKVFLNEIPNSDIYVVATNTSAVSDVCHKIAETNKHALVCIESTVPVGTTRRIAKEQNLSQICVCPHRLWKEDMVNRGINQLRVLGALTHEALMEAHSFYGTLKIPVHLVYSVEAAEMTKLAENAYRFIQIAYVQELSQLCKELDLDFEAVRIACNTKWNVSLLEARNGIFGCLFKDIHLLAEGRPSALLRGAINADRIYKNQP